MDRIFGIASFVAFLFAAGAWWRVHYSTMFVAASLGAVFWVLSVRVKMRRIVTEADVARTAAPMNDPSEDDNYD